MSDDYSLPFGDARASFYGVTGIPTAWFDGMSPPLVGAYPYSSYLAKYNERRADTTDVTLTLAVTLVSGDTYKATATVGLAATGQAKTVRLYTVQVLDHWPPSKTYHRNGFKQAAQTSDVALTPGQTQIVENNFTLDNDSKNNKANVRFIAWAQQPNSSGPADTYQAAIASLSAPPSNDKGTLAVDTTPVKGEVFVDGTSWGIAPQQQQVSVGSHTVSFGDVLGYEKPASQQVYVQKDQLKSVTGTYTPQPELGTLTVDTTPVKGVVLVDGATWGTAPQSRQVAAGQHTVSFGDVAGYDTPAAQDVTVQKNLVTTVVGQYRQPGADTGTLVLDTVPVKGVVCVDGVCYGLAPQTVVLPVGDHTVNFEPVAGYTTPPDQVVTVVKDQTTNVVGTYAAADMGTLAIDTTPVKGVVCVDSVCYGPAPQTVQAAVGEHTVTFEAVAGYTAPPAQVVTVVKDQTTNVTGTYVPDVGTVVIDSTPVKGVVCVDGVCYNAAPQTLQLLVGSHVVSFEPVDGYTAPPNQQILVQKDKTLNVLGTYVQDKGTLLIDSTPVKGVVCVDGVCYGLAPQSVPVPVGPHTVTFEPVNGYTKPEDRQVTVAQKNQTVTVTGTYVQDAGTLTLDSTPVKGLIVVDDVGWGIAPQTRTVPVGEHKVSFGAVPGYTAPVERTVTIQKDQTTTLEGTYQQQLGILKVDTAPVKGEVFVNGVSWGVAPQSREIAIGQHTVSFGDTPGYTAPSYRAVVVLKDWENSQLGIYQKEPTGTLSIDTAPAKGEVFVDGASWGVAPQSRELPLGQYTVSFALLKGYTEPLNRAASVDSNQTTTVVGTYVKHEEKGTLSVDTTPLKAEVFVNGTSWGTAPQSRQVLSGEYTVTFGTAAGYAAPASQQVTVQKDQVASAKGEYAAGTVTPSGVVAAPCAVIVAAVAVPFVLLWLGGAKRRNGRAH